MGTGDPVSDIDARLERLATVSGTVTDADGAPVAGAGVAAYQDEGEWVHVADATTDEAGRYSLLGLHAGVTKVRFAGTGALAGEWWNDKDTLRDADACRRAGEVRRDRHRRATDDSVERRRAW